MKIINCGYVTYIILGNHIATIVYNVNNGQPSATIYYDGKLGEIIEAENGLTMRLAFKSAKWTIRRDEHLDRVHPEWIAKLLKRSGLGYR